MISTWLNGLSPSEKEEIINAFQHNAVFRQRTNQLMQDKIDAERKKSLSADLYDSANWGLKQADSIGYIRALTEMIKLMQENSRKRSIT